MRQPASIKPQTLVIIAVVGVLLSIAGFLYSYGLEQRVLQQKEARLLEQQRAGLDGQVDAVVEIIDAVASFMASPEPVSRQAFSRFTAPVLSRHPEIYSIQWLPRIVQRERYQFELDLSIEGFTRGITELVSRKTELVTAAQRPEYFPILFAEPFSRNSAVVGFDVLTRPRNGAIMEQSLNQGVDFLISSPFRLVQDRSGGETVIFLRPVYSPDRPLSSVSERQAALLGYIVALIRPQVLLDQLQSEQHQTALLLEDVTVEPGRVLARSDREFGQARITDQTFTVLSRQWRLQQSVDASAPMLAGLPFWVLLLGGGLTALVVALLRRLQQALARAVAANEHTQSYLDTVETLILALNPDGRITMVNRKTCELLGQAEETLLGTSWFSQRFMHHPAEQREAFMQVMHEQPLSGQHSDAEYSIHTAGEDQIIAWHNALQRDENGQIIGMLCAGINVTQQRHLQGLEHIQGQAMQSTLEGASLQQVLTQVVLGIEQQKPGSKGSILLLDDTGQHLHCGAAPSLAAGYNEAIEGIQIGDGVGSCGTAAYRRERVIVEDIQNHAYWAPYKELAGTYQLASCWSEPIFGKKGRILGTFAIYHAAPCAPTASDLDMIHKIASLVGLVVEEFQAEAQLVRYANTDALTGLPNRRSLFERLDHELARIRRFKQPMALCMLDIDHFKRINDSYGHEFGDRVLQQLSQTMSDMMRETDCAGRIGGEEFAIILPGADHQQAAQAAERLRLAIEQLTLPTAAGAQVTFTVSIGVAVIDTEGPTALESSQVLSVADRCLYSAKRAGRNQVSFIPAVLEPIPSQNQS